MSASIHFDDLCSGESSLFSDDHFSRSFEKTLVDRADVRRLELM